MTTANFIGQKTLPIDVIRIDGDTQPRDGLNEEHLATFVANMSEGMEYDAPDVHFDGKSYWLSSGFHRYHAYLKLKRNEIVCNVIKGTRRDAWLHAIQSNSKHGLPLSNREKRQSIIKMLDDVEYSTWSNRQIANVVGCSHVLVLNVKKGIKPDTKPDGKSKAGIKGEVKTTKEEKKVETPPPPTESPKIIEMQNQIEALAEENEKLTKQLAKETAADPDFAEQTIDDLREENKQLRLEVKSLKISRDQFQAENAQLIKQVNYLTKKLKQVSPA